MSRLIFLGISYSVISSKHLCGHVEGGYPARCYILDASECKEKCTSFDLCIAYGVRLGSEVGNSYCFLMTSTGSCPDGWTFLSGNTATQRSDLVPSDISDFNCMAKGTA